ncbi:hypothetical protein C8J56DRAFT_904767 [Mycena floridula]|nr:hypothetical protein C8J56DRAFT_904767 [Mycena floridula]
MSESVDMPASKAPTLKEIIILLLDPSSTFVGAKAASEKMQGLAQKAWSPVGNDNRVSIQIVKPVSLFWVLLGHHYISSAVFVHGSLGQVLVVCLMLFAQLMNLEVIREVSPQLAKAKTRPFDVDGGFPRPSGAREESAMSKIESQEPQLVLWYNEIQKKEVSRVTIQLQKLQKFSDAALLNFAHSQQMSHSHGLVTQDHYVCKYHVLNASEVQV